MVLIQDGEQAEDREDSADGSAATDDDSLEDDLENLQLQVGAASLVPTTQLGSDGLWQWGRYRGTPIADTPGVYI